jgi:Gluconate 2-dehydrogenase subunit 3
VAEPGSFPSATLRALLDRLIPRDDFPGAIDAGVENYVMRQLAGDCALEAPAVRQGLIQLDAEARAKHGTALAVLPVEQQDEILRELEAGKTSTRWPIHPPAAVFFARLVDLAHEGFYADPGNGGNRDAVSWEVIGYRSRRAAGSDPTPGRLSPPSSP